MRGSVPTLAGVFVGTFLLTYVLLYYGVDAQLGPLEILFLPAAASLLVGKGAHNNPGWIMFLGPFAQAVAVTLVAASLWWLRHKVKRTD